MATYDLTNLTNSTGVLEYVATANDLSGGFLIGGLLAGFFVIMLISFKLYETADGVLASSVMTFFLAFLFWISKTTNGTALISDGVFYFWAASVFAAAIFSYFERNL